MFSFNFPPSLFIYICLIEIYDPSCRHFARELRAAVVSVEYRLAPEHTFPAQLDDATTVLRYLMREAPRWSIDRTRIAVAGSHIHCSYAVLSAALVILLHYYK